MWGFNPRNSCLGEKNGLSENLSTHCTIGGHGGMFHEDVFSANNHHLIYAASHQRFQRDMGAFV